MAATREEAALRLLAQEAQLCTNCPLYARATQTVFGEGPADAEVVFVGEQPGDQEDKHGTPFVGPAGGVLDRALEEVGIARERTYVTNAVKHFKWEPRGKRRIHQRPSGSEITACVPWLAQELATIRPELVVVLGAVAAQGVSGPRLKVTRDRGQIIEGADVETAVRRRLGPNLDVPPIVVTIHPSAVLRADDREDAYRGFVADLMVARDWLAAHAA
jgi:DNA polymerase